MSKITNDGLTRSGTGSFIAVPIYGNSGRRCERLKTSFKRFFSHLQCFRVSCAALFVSKLTTSNGLQAGLVATPVGPLPDELGNQE